MFDGRPPFQELAFPEFKQEFGDLFSVRAQVEDYEHGMIEGVMSDLFLMHLESGDRSHWAKTVRAAHARIFFVHLDGHGGARVAVVRSASTSYDARRLLSGSESGLSGSIAYYRLPGVTH
jgi:hypothetical protein